MAVKVVPVENSDLLAVALPPDERFEAAFTAATAKPSDETPWEALEATVVSDERQARRLLDFYRGHITSDVPKAILNVLSHRAARFAGDCFGESAPETIDVLRAVLKSAPDADWAFRPLIVALTMTERWRDVLDAYDARLAIAGGFDRRAEILEEAARIAKDFVGDHARAVGYLEQLFRLRPADGQVASSLERLLERHERWAELVAARRFRLEVLAGAEARELRLRIAATLHEKLAQPDAALAEVRVLLPDLHEDAPLARLLEGLLADERATPATRLDALDALRAALRGDRRRRARARPAPDRDRLRQRRSPARPAARVRRSPEHAGRRLGRPRSVRRPHRARARRSGDRGQPAATRRGGARSRPAGRGAGDRCGGLPAFARRPPRRAAGSRGARRGSPARTPGPRQRAVRGRDRRRGRHPGAAAREPSPAGGDLRRARQQGAAARRARAARGRRAQAGRQALHLGAGRGAGAGDRRRRPGAGRLAGAAGAGSGRRRGAGGGARSAGPCRTLDGGDRASAPPHREHAARPSDPRRSDRDGDDGPRAAGRRRARDRALARGGHALRRR